MGRYLIPAYLIIGMFVMGIGIAGMPDDEPTPSVNAVFSGIVLWPLVAGALVSDVVSPADVPVRGVE